MNKQERDRAHDGVTSCDVNVAESCKPEEAPNENVNRGVEMAGELSADESVASKFTEMFINASRTQDAQLCTSVYVALAVMVMFCCWAVRHYFRVRKQHQQWYELSNKELAKIRQRSFASTSETKLLKDPPESILELESETISKYRPSPDSLTCSASSEDKDQTRQVSSCPVNCDEVSLPAVEENNISDIDSMTKSASTNNLASVRARQQEIHERRIISAKQQRLQHQKHRQQRLVESLQHDVADKAHQRRKQAISQEQESIMKPLDSNTAQREQTLLEELQEMERQALLQHQNQEYNESLRQDQERTRIKELKMTEFKLRRKAIRDAKSRLFLSGAQLPGILDDFELKQDTAVKINAMMDHNTSVQVKILLPTGQKFQGVFAEVHCIGLLYDFALAALDKESLLWSDESLQKDSLFDESDLDYDTSSTSFDYASIQSEWNEMFCRFSLVSTYPQKIHHDLNLTLLQSDFVQSTSLLVVIQSD
jgi:hypothetical protein